MLWYLCNIFNHGDAVYMKTTISAEKLSELLRASDRLEVIDVRDPDEFANFRIEGSTNIPLNDLSDRIMEYESSGNIIFVCQSGKRSLQAAFFASSLGYINAFSLEGGIIKWNEDEH